MTFVLNYNQGYEVGVVMENESGYLQTFPLRNFGNRQGDAKMYQLHDCPMLTIYEIKMLIKRYNPADKYERINRRCFIRHDD